MYTSSYVGFMWCYKIIIGKVLGVTKIANVNYFFFYIKILCLYITRFVT